MAVYVINGIDGMGHPVDKSFVTHAGSQGLYCWP